MLKSTDKDKVNKVLLRLLWKQEKQETYRKAFPLSRSSYGACVEVELQGEKSYKCDHVSFLSL